MKVINQIVFIGTTPVRPSDYPTYKDFVNAIFEKSSGWHGFRYFSDDTYYRVCGKAKSNLRIGMCLTSKFGEIKTSGGGWDFVIENAFENGADLTPVFEGQWVEVHMPERDNKVEVIGEKPATPSLTLPNKAKFEMYVDGKRYRLIDYRLPKKDELFMETFSWSRVTKITRCLQPFVYTKCFIFEEVTDPLAPTLLIPDGVRTMTVGLSPFTQYANKVGRVEKEIRKPKDEPCSPPFEYSTANERILAHEIDAINEHLGRK